MNCHVRINTLIMFGRLEKVCPSKDIVYFLLCRPTDFSPLKPFSRLDVFFDHMKYAGSFSAMTSSLDSWLLGRCGTPPVFHMTSRDPLRHM